MSNFVSDSKPKDDDVGQGLLITTKEFPEGHILVALNGILNASSFSDLEQALQELFDKGHYQIIIDLANMTYISSAGVGVFVGAQPIAQEHNGNLVLMRPVDSVQNVFDLLGLGGICPIVTDYESAKFKLTEAPTDGGDSE